MKVALIAPSRESEKAISGYSNHLVEALKEEDINVTEINYLTGSPLTLFRKISRLKKYDIIHIEHEYNLLGWYGSPFFIFYLLAHLIGNKIVTTMHTVLSQKEKFIGNPLKTFLRKMLYLTQNRIINWFSDEIIVHANFFKRILAKEYGFPEDKITILPQGIIRGIKIIPKTTAKKRLKLLGNVYLIIGNFVPDHGGDIILKKAKEIGKTMLIVTNQEAVNYKKQKGRSNYLASCIKYVNDNKLSKWVRFDVSSISDASPKWWLYFFAADLILQPYRGGVGSGIFTHAMAAKKPVIGSNINFFREISKKYGCLKIAQKEEDYPTIIKEAMKKNNYRKLVKECERYSKENSWDEIAKAYKKLYSTLNLGSATTNFPPAS